MPGFFYVWMHKESINFINRGRKMIKHFLFSKTIKSKCSPIIIIFVSDGRNICK